MNFAFIHSKKFIIAGYIIFCFVIGLIFGYLKLFSRPISQTKKVNSNKTATISAQKIIPTAPADLQLNYTPGKVSADSKHISILLLGFGGAGHDGGYLSDAIILVYLDVIKQKLAFIHIPRDIWVDLQVGKNSMPMKINGALAMGTKTSNYPVTTVSKDNILKASSLTKQAVTTITGIPIDFVVTVDFNNFIQAIDSLKGIDVNVAKNFNDPWYPKKGFELELCGHTPEEVTAMSATMSGFLLEKQFPCRYENLYFKAGKNHMNGETALKYGRSRHTSSDFDRGLRQISIIRAIISKLFSLKALDNIMDFYQSLTKSVKTDITANQIEIIAPILKTVPNLQVVELGLDTNNVLTGTNSSFGGAILIPKEGEGNWQTVQNFIKEKI